ncbi:hypothetical protein [Aidingimonas halophila]|uniref:Uncharacterized protein n=1 Tax=Aidingimonas halophila TaxID=574349 RepID=A0A1H2ZSF4_9GAMM|nr:hypothetical protein [Aidingimonas halophila]GHC16499.1 hypothetical protein GCM10008094_02210 [Aidingimonas halophila]SDX19609.1 hypothetical protein SAMN05443545_104224 [Aidingimonas halophila]
MVIPKSSSYGERLESALNRAGIILSNQTHLETPEIIDRALALVVKQLQEEWKNNLCRKHLTALE